MVLSNCQSFPGTGSPRAATPGFGLKVPGKFHFGYSSKSRAHSLRLTSKISSMSSRAVRTIYPGGLFVSGDIWKEMVSNNKNESHHNETDLITKKTNEELWPLLLPCLSLLSCVCRKWVEFDDFRRNQDNGQIVACQNTRINIVETFIWLGEARCYVVEIILIENYQGSEQVVEKLNDLSVPFAQ